MSTRNYLEDMLRRAKQSFVVEAESKLTVFLGYSLICAVLGMFQFGFNLGVINAPERTIKRFIEQVDASRKNSSSEDDRISEEAVNFIWATVVSIFAIGGMLGGAVGGWIADRFGRKGGLLLNTSVGVLGGILMGVSNASDSYEMIVVGRFVVGCNCGLATILAPMYVSEISPVDRRGGFGVLNQLAVTVGLLTGQILGLESVLGGDSWPYLLGLAIVPSALQFALLLFCCESPLYLLLKRGNREQARRALVGLRGSLQVEPELDDILVQNTRTVSAPETSYRDLITSPSLRRPLTIAVVMQLSQQLNGILAVFYYSTNIFLNAGMSESGAEGATVGVGVVMVLMTLVSIPLIESLGRRSLHLWGLGGMFLLSICITIALSARTEGSHYVAVIVTLAYVVFFAIGPGSIPWLITAELFAQSSRAKAMAIAVAVNWGSNFIAGLIFPTLQSWLGALVFIPFSVLLALFWLFTYHLVPETKGKTVEQIVEGFQVAVVNYGSSSRAELTHRNGDSTDKIE